MNKAGFFKRCERALPEKRSGLRLLVAKEPGAPLPRLYLCGKFVSGANRVLLYAPRGDSWFIKDAYRKAEAEEAKMQAWLDEWKAARGKRTASTERPTAAIDAAGQQVRWRQRKRQSTN